MQGDHLYKYLQNRRNPRQHRRNQQGYYPTWTPNYQQPYSYWQNPWYQYRPQNQWDYQDQRWQPRPTYRYPNTYSQNSRNYRSGYQHQTYETVDRNRPLGELCDQEYHYNSPKTNHVEGNIQNNHEVEVHQKTQEVQVKHNDYKCLPIHSGFWNDAHVHPEESQNYNYPTLHTSEAKGSQQMHYSGGNEINMETPMEITPECKISEMSSATGYSIQRDQASTTQYQMSTQASTSTQNITYNDVARNEPYPGESYSSTNINLQMCQQATMEHSYENQSETQSSQEYSSMEGTDTSLDGVVVSETSQSYSDPGQANVSQVYYNQNYQIMNSENLQNAAYQPYRFQLMPVMVVYQNAPYYYTNPFSAQTPSCNHAVFATSCSSYQNIAENSVKLVNTAAETGPNSLENTNITTDQVPIESIQYVSEQSNVPSVDWNSKITGVPSLVVKSRQGNFQIRRDSGYQSDAVSSELNKNVDSASSIEEDRNSISNEDSNIIEKLDESENSQHEIDESKEQNSTINLSSSINELTANSSFSMDTVIENVQDISGISTSSKSWAEEVEEFEIQPSNSRLSIDTITENLENIRLTSESSSTEINSEEPQIKISELNSTMAEDKTENVDGDESTSRNTAEVINKSPNISYSSALMRSAKQLKYHNSDSVDVITCSKSKDVSTKEILADKSSIDLKSPEKQCRNEIRPNVEITNEEVRTVCPLKVLHMEHCEWTGCLEKLVKHFESDHASHLTSGTSIKLKKNCFKIVRAFGEIFICYSNQPPRRNLFCYVYHPCTNMCSNTKYQFNCQLISGSISQNIDRTKDVAPIQKTIRDLRISKQCSMADRKVISSFQGQDFFIVFNILKRE